jgi:competence protein ComEC
MEFEQCFFLDVGQGNSSVIRLLDRKVILFDAGPVGQGTVWNFLHANDVAEIECIVISHNDADHIRGFFKIAEAFGHRIKNIFVLKDRLKNSGQYDAALSLFRRGIIPRPQRAEVRNLVEPLEIYRNERISVEILYPDFLCNESSLEAGSANRTSVIARVQSQNRTAILFPGDSTIEAWRDLETFSKLLPLQTDIVVVPHHGGAISNKPEDVAWLYSDAIQPKNAIVSVSSGNSFGHPQKETIDALVKSGTRVLCTQLTHQCEPNFGNVSPGVMQEMLSFSRSSSESDNRHIGCAGTVVSYLEPNKTKILRRQKHRNAIKNLAHPMCMQKPETTI